MAKLVRVTAEPRQPGRLKGRVRISPDFDAPLPDEIEDPFDRMLIAQARLEGLTIVTRDAAFRAYGVDLLVI